MASTRKILARVWIDESSLHDLHDGQEARVTLRSAPSRTLRARLDRVAAEADRQTHEVLADEPTAALDSTRSRDVMQLFRRVAHERGAAVVVVTHDHRTLDAFDTVYEMEDGRLFTHGSRHTIDTEPAP